METIRIATRKSALAMWQAEHVQALLQKQYPNRVVTLVPMSTRGDEVLDKKLSVIGGKGLFVKELEAAMLDGRADMAVHSLKDVPMVLPEGFRIAAVTVREDPRDAFVSSKCSTMSEMPAGAVVGTSSLRRELMLKREFPHLVVKSVRGNVGTRLGKLDAGEYDALVMASAGLKRLGFGNRIRALLPVEVSLPSPGQGALAIEVLAKNESMSGILAFLNNDEVRASTQAERAVSRALGGSCQVPLAAHAVVREGALWLRALVGDHRTGETLYAEAQGEIQNPLVLAERVVSDLRSQGADSLLQRVLQGL